MAAADGGIAGFDLNVIMVMIAKNIQMPAFTAKIITTSIIVDVPSSGIFINIETIPGP